MDLINETSARLRLKPNEQKKSHDLPKTNTIQDIETCYLIYSIKNVALDDVEITIFCGQRKNKKKTTETTSPNGTDCESIERAERTRNTHFLAYAFPSSLIIHDLYHGV